MPRASAATWRRFPPTPASFSTRWSARMSMQSMDLARPSRSSRRPPAAARARPSERSPKSTTIFACCSPRSASRIAPSAASPISRQSAEQIVQRVMALTPEDRVMVLAPIVRGRKGEFKKEMETLLKHGYTRARVDGELVNLDDDLNLDKRKNHTIEVDDRPPAGKAGHRASPGNVGRSGDEAGRRPGAGRRWSAAMSNSIRKSWPARIAASACRNSSRARFPSTACMEPVPSATASAAATISIPRR